MKGYVEDDDRVQVRLMNLLELEERQVTALEHTTQHQAVVKRWFDKRVIVKVFDKAKEKPSNHTKFQRFWIGPYQIAEIVGENTFRLGTLDGYFLPFLFNGQFLKHYFEA